MYALDPHHPHEEQAALFAAGLEELGFEVKLENSFEPLLDRDLLSTIDLIVPNRTGGTIGVEHLRNFVAAVVAGVGLAGCHAGMGDWERTKEPGKPGFQYMTGGQYVMHYGGDTLSFDVNVVDRDHFITRGLSDFRLVSEQWYMHVDPANHVLATTPFPVQEPYFPNSHVDIPVAWTRSLGKGRVFFLSLGHYVRDLERDDVSRLWKRGFLWAAHAEDAELLLKT